MRHDKVMCFFSKFLLRQSVVFRSRARVKNLRRMKRKADISVAVKILVSDQINGFRYPELFSYFLLLLCHFRRLVLLVAI